MRRRAPRARPSAPRHRRYGSGSRIDVWSLPAQPTVTASLAPSRLTSRRPDTSAASSAFAPSSPCSSETVRSSSSGPCATAGSSTSASASATPMPLSAPSVVPSARTQSSSTRTSIRPSRGSNRLVRIALAHHVEVRLEDDDRRGLAPGRGRDARRRRSPRRPWRLRHHAPPPRRGRAPAPAPSAFDGRAMRVSSKKRSQTSAGSSPASGELTVAA